MSRILSSKRFEEQLLQLKRDIKSGINSREALKQALGEKNFSIIEDEYDPSDLCKVLGISDSTIINIVKQYTPEDGDYTKLWGVTIIQVYMDM